MPVVSCRKVSPFVRHPATPEKKILTSRKSYGQVVDDFLSIDKNYIWTIATSALQEVDRQLQAERARNDDLQVRLQALEARIEALE